MQLKSETRAAVGRATIAVTRADALAGRVSPFLLQRPVLTTRVVVGELGTTQASARNALEALEGTSIVVGSQLDLLDGLAQRSRRM
ncbi:hypothetical protein CKJ80_09450 [Corynebacterium hadale]|uniref:Uncharacterized protein n=1 Tax=Corynebacterium hadale TaxID=2026255 RepID=A0AB36RIA0_9CORY|nr:hypothetical protein CKJ80_09450 [Corynebacterium hadale]